MLKYFIAGGQMHKDYFPNIDDRFTSEQGLFTFSSDVPEYLGNPYQQNSLGYRSDDFTSTHNGKHVLFAGCSNTFGMGMDDEEKIWPRILFNKIKLKENLSGFFNLGKPGGSIEGILSLCFRYIKTYGPPDVIFIVLPDIYRGLRLHEKIRGYYDVFIDPEKYRYHGVDPAKSQQLADIIDSTIPSLYETYAMFEEIAKQHGIRLITTSYHSPTVIDLFNEFNFETFYDFNNINLDKFLYENDDLSADFLYASDGSHWGTGHHMYTANLLYNILYENTN